MKRHSQATFSSLSRHIQCPTPVSSNFWRRSISHSNEDFGDACGNNKTYETHQSYLNFFTIKSNNKVICLFMDALVSNTAQRSVFIPISCSTVSFLFLRGPASTCLIPPSSSSHLIVPAPPPFPPTESEYYQVILSFSLLPRLF